MLHLELLSNQGPTARRGYIFAILAMNIAFAILYTEIKALYIIPRVYVSVKSNIFEDGSLAMKSLLAFSVSRKLQ